jgi:hypothetical protein
MEQGCKTNYFRLHKKSIFYGYFACIDVDKRLSERLFEKHGVKVKYGAELYNNDNPYLIRLFRIKKKDEPRLEPIFEELTNSALIHGHTDYIKFCDSFVDSILSAAKQEWQTEC